MKYSVTEEPRTVFSNITRARAILREFSNITRGINS